jgi:hypothetical protein
VAALICGRVVTRSKIVATLNGHRPDGLQRVVAAGSPTRRRRTQQHEEGCKDTTLTDAMPWNYQLVAPLVLSHRHPVQSSRVGDLWIVETGVCPVPLKDIFRAALGSGNGTRTRQLTLAVTTLLLTACGGAIQR